MMTITTTTNTKPALPVDGTPARDAVRRIIREPLAEHELDTLERHRRAAQYPIRYAACAGGPCDQGRKLCPSPHECRLDSRASAEPPRPPLRAGDFWRAVGMVVASWAAVALVLAALGVGQ